MVDVAAPDKATRLNAIPPTVGSAEWTPDGEQIIFAAAAADDAPPGYDELYALPRESNGPKVVPLSAGFIGQINASALFFPSGAGIVTQAGIRTRSAVVKIALDGKSAPSLVDLGAPVITGINTNRRQTGWVWLAESGGQPQKLCFAQRIGDPCTTAADTRPGPGQPQVGGTGTDSLEERRSDH